jgi:alkaline phosphatase
MPRQILLATILVLLLPACRSGETSPHQVILLLGDGLGSSQITFARDLLLEPGERFSFETLPKTGLMTTYSASNLVTDSAAAATALASGQKTKNQYVGVDPEKQPLTTLTDEAQRQGWRIGYVTNTAITHATPAAFYASVSNRYTQTDQIALDLLDQAPDVAFGGGWRDFLPPVKFGRRQDGRDLLAEAEEAGYSVWREPGDIDPKTGGKVLGLFAGNHLPLALDREQIPPAAQPPSLAQLTGTALSLLSADDRSFFLLVEGGRIDHAGHSFDAKALAAEVADFDAAVRQVLIFAKEHPDTLVISTADHPTGGLSINDFVDWKSFDSQHQSVDWITYDIRDVENPLGLEAARQVTGLLDLTEDELERIRSEGDKYSASRLLGRALGENQGITWVHAVDPWNTAGHTGEDVPLYASGPGSDSFQGVLDNAQVPLRIRRILAWPEAGPTGPQR